MTWFYNRPLSISDVSFAALSEVKIKYLSLKFTRTWAELRGAQLEFLESYTNPWKSYSTPLDEMASLWDQSYKLFIGGVAEIYEWDSLTTNIKRRWHWELNFFATGLWCQSMGPMAARQQLQWMGSQHLSPRPHVDGKQLGQWHPQHADLPGTCSSSAFGSFSCCWGTQFGEEGACFQDLYLSDLIFICPHSRLLFVH